VAASIVAKQLCTTMDTHRGKKTLLTWEPTNSVVPKYVMIQNLSVELTAKERATPPSPSVRKQNNEGCTTTNQTPKRVHLTTQYFLSDTFLQNKRLVSNQEVSKKNLIDSLPYISPYLRLIRDPHEWITKCHIGNIVLVLGEHSTQRIVKGRAGNHDGGLIGTDGSGSCREAARHMIDIIIRPSSQIPL